jgi:hypothetical protein
MREVSQLSGTVLKKSSLMLRENLVISAYPKCIARKDEIEDLMSTEPQQWTNTERIPG